MNAKTHTGFMKGPVGDLELQIDEPPEGVPDRGVAIVAHPHPLHGGNMNNKVVQTLAKAFTQAGYKTVRFNFRGVGQSQGTYANSTGETQDLLAVIKHFAPTGVICLGGFSFGTVTLTHALQALAAQGRDLNHDIARLILVGCAADNFELAPIATELHPKTFVLHAEADETVPLSAVMDWARPQSLPVTVIPAGSHFFHGQLLLLRSLVMRHLA